MPHESTGKKPSFLLFGIDCQSPSEAALFPPNPVDPSTVEDYREEVMLNLSSARELAVACHQRAQKKSKDHYDKTSRTHMHRRGDWVIVKFPGDETGKNRKLSQPWHGPYRVLSLDEPNMMVQKVYRKQDEPVLVHQSRVTPCPGDLPPGYYWYGRKHCSPGRSPCWIESLSHVESQVSEPAASVVSGDSMPGHGPPLGDRDSEGHSAPDQRPGGDGTSSKLGGVSDDFYYNVTGGDGVTPGLILREQDSESEVTHECEGEADGGGAGDNSVESEDNANHLRNGTRKNVQRDAAGDHTPEKMFGHDVACSPDPSLARSKYSLRTRVKPPERWLKLGASFK